MSEELKQKVQKAKIIYQALPKDLNDATLYLRFRTSSLLQMTSALAKVIFRLEFRFLQSGS